MDHIIEEPLVQPVASDGPLSGLERMNWPMIVVQPIYDDWMTKRCRVNKNGFFELGSDIKLPDTESSEALKPLFSFHKGYEFDGYFHTDKHGVDIFIIYDIKNARLRNETKTFTERFHSFETDFNKLLLDKDESLQLNLGSFCNSLQNLELQLIKYKAEKYDRVLIRNIESPYFCVPMNLVIKKL